MKTKNTFNVGDVVILKSGGPLMTIGSISGNECYCIWFTNDERKYGQFQSPTLMYPPDRNGSDLPVIVA
jgi:uncharacterized protein YodC (DUF2158 family)